VQFVAVNKGIWTNRRFLPFRIFCISFVALAVQAQDYPEASLKQADPISGEQTWQQYCAFCHTLRNGQGNMAGPNLFELFKRKVGTKPDFSYSDALKNANRDWTFLFNNTSRYEIKVGEETVIIDARFNQDKTISSSQGVTGEWRTEGSDGKDDRMCYSMEGVPGVDGQLTECFVLVLMFNPRVGARWPARFEQGNTYWAEIIEGRD
jgi:hypothetical protein